ncbi:MAG: hypothetical protein ACI9BO_002268 [Zhongshania sp.]|jgi:hypothetical protein
MIKFFRKIRQELLFGNKFSKYLIYAIGEIILVIIGILLALQINNRNSERIERNTFESNLKFVIEDLEQDKIDLLMLTKERQQVINKTDFILQAVKEEKVLTSYDIFINSEIMIWKSFDINNNGLERVLSSSLYEAIDFQPIRKNIRTYQLVYQRIEGLEKKLNESVEEMEIEMSKEGSILELYEYGNLINYGSEFDDTTKKEFENYVIDFNKSYTNNPPMLSLFQRGKLITKSIILTYDYFIEIGEDLQLEIESYLNKD